MFLPYINKFVSIDITHDGTVFIMKVQNVVDIYSFHFYMVHA